MLKLYNTLTKKIEELKLIKDKEVGLYTCGPTVYNFAHIGNLRTYIFEDLLKRVLEYNGLKVNHAMNITDVGHLVGDGDEGEDKLEVGAKREGKNPLDIAKFYAEKFLSDLRDLNIELPDPKMILPATQAIPEQIEIIKQLEAKGFAYKGEAAIYFNTSKLPDYGKLSGQKLSEKKSGARDEVVQDPDKKTPADFALWFFLKGKYENHILHWPSPWGEGFPGWHIECSAISRKLLGQPFDIHTGGVDHIGTHHTNEIAQSEAAFGVPLANVWMHGEFLLVNEGRMGKSEGNFITLDTLKKEKFLPIDYRYMCLQAHYRSQLNFTWQSLGSAHTALNRLFDFFDFVSDVVPGQIDKNFEKDFIAAIEDDLNVPKALAIAHQLLNENIIPLEVKKASLIQFDKIFGLNLTQRTIASIPPEVDKLAIERKTAKDQKDFAKSDELRKQIEALGYEVMDTPEGQKVKKKIGI